MSQVFRQYLQEHDGECPYNAHILVNYSRKHSNLKTLQWMDAHLLIEHYMIHDSILDFESDCDTENDEYDREESKYSQVTESYTTISKLSNINNKLNRHLIHNRSQQRHYKKHENVRYESLVSPKNDWKKK
eukprot:167669_1